jgi:DNA-binding winged helix-turn-helix (wHTH) protein
MAYKTALNLRHLHRKTWLPQQGQTPVIELNQNVEMGPFPRPTMEIGSLPVLDGRRLHLQTLREVLESDSYQVALVPRDEWGHIRGSQAEPFLAAAPAVLFSFSWTELVARVGEFARDSNALADCRVVRFKDVCVDFTKMEVSRSSGEPITLTTQEFKTLKCFLLNPDRVFSRDELLNEAWGYDNYPATRTVDNHVLKLRQKLERDPARPVHFRTVHGVGYKFVR